MHPLRIIRAISTAYLALLLIIVCALITFGAVLVIVDAATP